MRIFDKYEDNKGIYKISPSLFWEYDMPNFDWVKYRATVVQRVVEMGRLNDFYALFDLYGGIGAVAEIAEKEVDGLSNRDLQFMCDAFNLKKENTLCYKQKLSRDIPTVY